MYGGHPVETVTMVGLSENVAVEHEYDHAIDAVLLTFRGQDELVLRCTRKGFAAVTELVAAANATINAVGR
jgi:hypothetical protein